MNRKIIFALTLLLAFSIYFTHAAETELVGDRTMRISFAPSFGLQIQEWEGMEVGKVMNVSLGLGVEYGINNWFSVQALWFPGVNAWSDYDNGDYGFFSDGFIGFKAAIMGNQGFISHDMHRVAVGAGLKTPLPSRTDSAREGDKHLWGSAFQAYYDIMIVPLFYLNFFTEFVVYPDQRLKGPNYTTRSVKHPLDITFEIDSRFKYEILGKGVTLHWGIPLTLFVSPWINRNDANAEETQLSFTPGVFFTASFTDYKVPFDISVRYTAPVVGLAIEPIHRVSLLGRIYINL